MKKFASFFLAFMMAVLLFLSGCSTTIGNSSGSSTSDGGTVTLKFMGWEASPLETESVKKGLEMFMQRHPNIKVEYTPVPQEQYHSKLLTMMAGGAAPDVFFLGADRYRGFQKRNVLLDLTKKFDSEFKRDDFIPSSREIMEIDGKIYGVSSCTVSPVLYYNKKLFEKAGIPLPPSDPAKTWTWEEFLEAARKLTIKSGDKVKQYGVYGLENYYMNSALLLSNRGPIFSEDGKKVELNSSENKEVMQEIMNLRKQYGVSPESKLLENVGMKPAQMLQTGKIAMLVDGSWALQELAKMNFPVGVAPLPKFKDPMTHGQAHVHAAWAGTKHPQEAWELIKFLSSEEYQIQLIREGLWMPNRKSLYTENGIAKWYNEKVHPEGFKELIPYFRDAKAYPNVLIDKYKVTDIITEELDKFWYGNQPLNKTFENIQKRGDTEFGKQD